MGCRGPGWGSRLPGTPASENVKNVDRSGRWSVRKKLKKKTTWKKQKQKQNKCENDCCHWYLSANYQPFVICKPWRLIRVWRKTHNKGRKLSAAFFLSFWLIFWGRRGGHLILCIQCFGLHLRPSGSHLSSRLPSPFLLSSAATFVSSLLFSRPHLFLFFREV